MDGVKLEESKLRLTLSLMLGLFYSRPRLGLAYRPMSLAFAVRPDVKNTVIRPTLRSRPSLSYVQ